MKKYINLLFILLSFSFMSCVTWTSNYPEPFEDYTFTEISINQAKNIWQTFDLHSKISSEAIVYCGYPKETRVFHHCPITGDSYYHYKVEILQLVHNVTLDFNEYDFSNTKFYQADQDKNCIKIVDPTGYYTSKIYVSGWLTEMKVDEGSSHEYIFIKY